MVTSIGPSARHWPAAILLTLTPIALAALGLSPMLRTGYLADDTVSSLLPGMMRATGEGVRRADPGGDPPLDRGGAVLPARLG